MHKLIVFLQLNLLNIISLHRITNNKHTIVLVVLVYYDAIHCSGVRDGIVVKALRYKPAGRGFDSR